MKFKIDLHVHSKHSGDTDSEPEEAIQRAIELGLHGIAFTEHYYYGASEPVESLKEKYGDRILILRGVEFSTEEGHCLIYGVDTDAMSIRHASIKDVIPIVHQAGGVVIPSHPYRPITSLGDMVLNVQGFCALEGYNGCNMHAYNKKAIAAAKALKLPFIGGSDAHASRDVGSCFTEFKEVVTHDNLINVLKAGKYRGIDTRKLSRLILNKF